MEEQILDEFNEQPKNIEYVSLARRFNANLVDSLIIGTIALAMNYITLPRGMEILIISPSVIDLLYKVILEKQFGHTPGKKAVGIVVVGEDLRKITWQQSFVRNYYYVLSLLLMLIQYYVTSQPGSEYSGSISPLHGPAYLNYITYGLMIGFIIDCLMMSKSAENQTLHDKWAKTFVVKETFLVK